MRNKQLIFLMVYLLSASRLLATTYYVATNGNASNSGLTQAAPKTLAWAIANASAGDIVYIKAGNYGGGTYTQSNNGTSANPIQFIGTDGAWNPIVANNGCTFNTGDDVNSAIMPLLQEARVNLRGDGTALKLQGNYVYFKNFQVKYYEEGLRTTGDYCKIDNVFTLEQGNHNQADKADPFGAFYNGWGMTIQGESPEITNCLNVDAGAQGITFKYTNNPRADYCYVSAYLGVDNNGTWDGNPNDYYFLLSVNTTNGLFTNITVNRATANKHYGHGIVMKGGSGSITNNVVDGFTIYNTNLELQFPVVTNNICKNGRVIRYSQPTTPSNSAGGINLANGSSFNTFENIEIVNSSIFFKDWQDGLPGDVADASDDNDFSQIIIRDSWVAISFNYWQNGATTSAADRNNFNNLTIDNCDYLFSGNRLNTDSEFKNCIINDVTNFKLYPRGTSPGYPIDATYENCNFYNVGFTVPSGTNITTVDPQFVNLSNDDFTLQNTSPLVGQGVATPFLAAGNDIGAIQGSGIVPPTNNRSLSACKLAPNNSYTIDGTEELLWSTVSSDSINLPLNGMTRPSISDLSGTYKASWDENSLYLLVNVTDDNVITDGGGTYIHDDGLSIYIDGGNEDATSYDANDFNIGVNYGASAIFVNGTLYTGNAIVKADSLTSNGYQIELKVDWNLIGLLPNSINNLGLDIHINDDDDGGNRDQKIVWNDQEDLAYTNPSKLGDVVLSSSVCYTLVEVCQLTSSITIDGIEDAVWTNIDSNVLSIAPNGQTMPSEGDLSGFYKATWDNNSLYLWVDVKDDNISSDGGVYIHDDGLSIYIDGGNEDATSYDVNDFSLGFRYGTPDIYSNNSLYTGTGITKSEVLTPNGYLMEIKIDWSFLGVVPVDQNIVGIDVHVNDDDDGGNRDQKIMWADATDQAYNNPSVLGNLLLTTTSCGTFCSTSNATLNEISCGNYTLNNQTYTTSGTYTQTLVNTGGCDSIITLNLLVSQPTSATLSEVSCGSYTLNNQTYSTSGTYTQVLNNTFGCDSTITLNLTVLSPSSASIVETSCGTYSLNGQTYTTSGVYIQTLVNSLGCDSTLTLNLTIGNPSVHTLTENSCGAYTLNGQVYSSSGTYTQVLSNVSGCDSTITLNLTIDSMDLSISEISGLLTSNQANANYQWYNCDANAVVLGAINQFFEPDLSGNYAVILDNNSCVDTSACVYYNLSAITETIMRDAIVYPNPADDVLNIKSLGIFERLEILNGLGELVKTQKCGNNDLESISIKHLTPGIYILRMFKDEKSYSIRFVKA